MAGRTLTDEKRVADRRWTPYVKPMLTQRQLLALVHRPICIPKHRHMPGGS
jgi:hypothetical protein